MLARYPMPRTLRISNRIVRQARQASADSSFHGAKWLRVAFKMRTRECMRATRATFFGLPGLARLEKMLVPSAQDRVEPDGCHRRQIESGTHGRASAGAGPRKPGDMLEVRSTRGGRTPAVPRGVPGGVPQPFPGPNLA